MGRLLAEASGTGLGGASRKTLVERMVTREETLLAVMEFLRHPFVRDYGNSPLEVLEEQVLLAASFPASAWPRNPKPTRWTWP